VSRLPRRLLPLLLFTAVLGACVGPQPPGPTDSSASNASRNLQRKRITAAIVAEPATLSARVNVASAGTVAPGADAVEELVNGGLAHLDPQGNLVPQLAEDVPSLENGLWKLLPDGQMETTWSLKPSARWHDGTPVTADDLLFAVRVGQDGDLPAFSHPGFAAVQSVVATDQRTVTVRWNHPYTGADTMFTAVSPAFALPLPAHLLAAPYQDNKAGFLDLPYWGAEFVGTGAFKLID
jgi:ABC-type transport system substrate-binding protein